MPTGDLDLARRLASGEDASFEVFFEEYFPRLYRFALTRLRGDEDAAEDVVQTTLIKALAKIQTFRGEAALFTWLCSFCRHEISAWFARTGTPTHVSTADDSPETRALLEAIAAMSVDDPEQEYQRRELARRVHATLDHLPGRYGDALVWKYLEGLSVGEIAQRLDLGYKAAESHLTRARQAFRESFALVSGQPIRPATEPDGL
jgi:RNA polymerase sigma-70 factor (ECF subfamily)